MNNKIKIINILFLLALLLFFLGQGVWLYQVREMKEKEFEMRASSIFAKVIWQYITEEGIKKIADGELDCFSLGMIAQDSTDKWLMPESYEFLNFNRQLIYDYLYDHWWIDVNKVNLMYCRELRQMELPEPFAWVISDRNSEDVVVSCGRVGNYGQALRSEPIELGCGIHHRLVAFFDWPFSFRSYSGVLIVEGIFLVGFIWSLLWQWCYVHAFWKEAEVKMLGSAHLEHELKKPIAVLLSTLEDLMGNCAQRLTEREQLKLKMMRVRLMKMANITDTMLTICSNTIPDLQCVTMNIRREMEMVREIFNTLKPYAYIELRISAEAEQARVDEVYFGYMVCNLVDNAIKYGGDHPWVTIDCWKENRNFAFAVRDRGIGISKRDQKRIFRAFYRIHDQQVCRTTGFGLGLAFVSKIVEAYGGTIRVESEVGIGSNFIIVLPQ